MPRRSTLKDEWYAGRDPRGSRGAILSVGLAVALSAAALALLPSVEGPSRPKPPSASPPPASARLDRFDPPPPSRPPPQELAGDGPVTTGTTAAPPAAAVVQPTIPPPTPLLPPAPPKGGPPPELTQAEDHLRRGDVTGARLWLTRAAEGGDAEATFRLAETFDAKMLKQWGVVGLGGDATRAREYYTKAANAGHATAQERLQRMARSPLP